MAYAGDTPWHGLGNRLAPINRWIWLYEIARAEHLDSTLGS